MPLSEKVLSAAAANVEKEIKEFFSRFFEAGADGGYAIELPGAKIDTQELLVSSNSVAAVPWVFRGRHIDEFLGVCATGILVELRGTTYVDASSDNEADWKYSRYIDYLGALHQLGVTAVSRPAFTPDDFEEVVKYMRSS